MRESLLPIEFSSLQGKVSYVAKVANDEYSSSCPQCGGSCHQDGTLPDRFRMWTNATGKNKVFGWCRKCSYTWFPDSNKPLSHEEMEKWRQEQLERERQRKADAELAIKNLMSQKIWIKYHEGLNEWAVDVLHSWGIKKEYVDYWKLGLIDDYVVHSKEEPYHSPAISIPNWQLGWKISNVKVRVLNPKNGNDRYRSLYKTGFALPFVAFPGQKYDTCFVVEGEKKAMVTAEYLSQDNIQVIGVPTKTPNAESLKVFDNFGKIYMCLDPDAKVPETKNGVSAQTRLANLLGRERVSVVSLPGKIDDLVVRNGLNRNGMVNAMRYAKRLEAK